MLFPELEELLAYRQQVHRLAKGSRYQNNKTHGDYTSILHGIGVEFETLRPYVVGDDLRYIDWRTSARVGKPQIKTFRSECDRNVLIVTDANAYMRFGTRKTFKSIQAARVTALMSWASLEEKDRVGGLVYGDVLNGMQYFKPQSSRNSILKMLDILCSKDIDKNVSVSLPQALDKLLYVLTPQSAVIIVADFSMCEISEITKTLISIKRLANVMLVPIYDAADEYLPDVATLKLTHNHHSQIIYKANKKAKNKYHQLWTSYRKELDSLAKKLHIKVLWLRTDEDPVKKIWKK